MEESGKQDVQAKKASILIEAIRLVNKELEEEKRRQAEEIANMDVEEIYKKLNDGEIIWQREE